MQKPNVGDMAVMKSGESFVIREVKDRHEHHNLPQSYQWYVVGDYPNEMGVWDQYLDRIIPREQGVPNSELKVGDKVRLTPKAGGETVVVGKASYVAFDVVSVRIEGDGYRPIQFNRANWNIEKIEPSTVDKLNALGQCALVANPTNPDYYGYFKHDGVWRSADEYKDELEPKEVAYWIDHEDFEIIFEGVPR